ncbi:MAG: translocation/assembly module TamB, partial [Bacteroidales bacterium]|nr:translocation/assembly module TamB [Bacteroidales bacterium]
NANINVIKQNNGNTNINGNLLGTKLAISDIVENKELGKFDIIDTLNFNISPAGDVEGVSNGRINNLELMGYRYESVTFDAIINKYVYQGEVKIVDPNIKLDLEGMFVNNESLPKVKFTTKIEEFIPHKLNLYDDSLFSARLNLKGSITGLDPDILTGKLECKINKLTNQYGSIQNKEIDIKADYDKIDSVKTIQILSEFLDLKLWGDIKISTIASSFQEYLNTLMPSLADSLNYVPVQNIDSLYTALAKDNNFDFDIKLKDLSDIGTMFFPDIKIKPGTTITGKYNLEPGNFYLQGYCPTVDVAGTKMDEIIVNGDNQDQRFNVYLNTNKIFLSETNSLDNTLIHSYIQNDKLYVNIDWNSFLDSLNYSGDISLNASLENRLDADPLIKLELDSSTFSFQKNKWIINSNQILIDTNFIDLGHIYAYSNNKEKIDISGRLSASKKDTLKLQLDKIQLSSFNTLFDDTGLQLQGTVYGNTQIVSVLGNPQVNSVDSILGLQLDDHKLGDVRLKAIWDNKNSILDLYAETQLINTKNMILTGKYFVEKDDLDFNIEVNRFPFDMATPFVQEYISDIAGKISGNISIKGTSKKPDIRAGLKFVRAGFKVNYLNTYYTFTDSLFIENNMIRMDRMKINAGRNSFAWLSGKITHKNFDDIKLDISLEPRNFLFLRTQETDSSAFYGTVYASGGIGIKGGVDNMDINIKLKTEKGTRFFLPLSSSSEASESSYITFVSYDTTDTKKEVKHQVDLSGMNINFELEATSDAEMQIIMDETVGDMIKVRGMGNLDIKVNNVGDIFLYGIYTVTKGDYLFTLQNLVNKKFIVDQGSTIRWSGDPYNAAMDMTAVYKIRKVPLYDLMKEESFKELKTNVECLLGMKGNLTDPRIEFGLNLPDAKEPVISNVNGLAQDDLNQQILSLLILGQFQPLPGLKSDDASAGGGALSNNAFEMLSNQLSNWLSKISDDFDIGVNYKQGGEMTSDEVEVALSTQLFNDRVSINTNLGVGTGTTTETTQSEQSSANKIVGDVEIEVKLNKKGSLRSKVFNRTNQRTESSDQALYTQGVGVFYRKEFNTVGELMDGFWKTITFQKKKEKEEEEKRKKEDINK